MQERLPFFADLEASCAARQRGAGGADGRSTSSNGCTTRTVTSAIPRRHSELVPQDLTRRIALRHRPWTWCGSPWSSSKKSCPCRPFRRAVDRPSGHFLKYSRDLEHRQLRLRRCGPRHERTWDSRMARGGGGVYWPGPGSVVPGGRAELGHHRAGDRTGGNPAPGPNGSNSDATAMASQMSATLLATAALR